MLTSARRSANILRHYAQIIPSRNSLPKNMSIYHLQKNNTDVNTIVNAILLDKIRNYKRLNKILTYVVYPIAVVCTIIVFIVIAYVGANLCVATAIIMLQVSCNLTDFANKFIRKQLTLKNGV